MAGLAAPGVIELKSEVDAPDAPTAADASADTATSAAQADTGEPDLVAVPEAKQRASKVMKDGAQMKADVEDLGDLVKKRRFIRLHEYAMRSGWSPEEPPPGVDREAQGWWQEWRELRDRDSQQRAAAAPRDMAAPARASAP